MAVATKKHATWQENLSKARELRGKSAVIVFDRVSLLIDVFNDQAWRQRNGHLDEHALLDLMDAEVVDLAASFTELRAMVEHFPLRDSWAEGRLDRMKAETLAALNESRKQAGGHPRKARRVTLKEHEALQQQAAVQVKQLTKAEDRIAELAEENTRLRAQLAKAEGRIEQLEKLLSQSR